MDTTTVNVVATLDASPDAVYETLTDAEQHSAFTGGTSKLDAEPGGDFAYLDGAITGRFTALEPGQRICQTLHAASWPEGHTAEVETRLTPLEDGRRTLVRVTETGVPAAEIDNVTEGWGNYWAALARYLRERKLDVVRRFVEEYKNRHNTDIVDDLVAEDCRVHIPMPGLPPGREGMRVNGRTVTGAFPDVRVEREFFVTEGDIVVERARAEATHLGPLVGVEATEAPVTWTELHAYRVADGMITEVWSEADFLGIMVQIGAVDMPTA